MSGPLYLKPEPTRLSIAGIALPRITVYRVLVVAILAAGLYSTYVRFVHGLGASTGLSDANPWGLWVAFDVLCGVGLAAGGFTITAAVHIFGIKSLEPIVRPAVLTAFLGYLLVSVGLVYDLGRPYNVWHPLILWNPHSVMFEVAWCVMLYTTVLALEFSPAVFQKLGMVNAGRMVKKFSIPLVTAGVLLSTMHQSSLGTVFLIAPTRLHPLWYSSALPIFFFVSAIAVGLSMVIFESYLSYRFLGHRLKAPVLASLARVSVPVLGVYTVMKLFDLVYRGVAGQIFTSGIEGPMFVAELLIGAVIPLVLFVLRPARESRHGLFIAATMVVLGFVLNRLNVSLTGFEASSGGTYFPTFTEVSVTMMLVVLGFLGFGLAAKKLPIFQGGAH